MLTRNKTFQMLLGTVLGLAVLMCIFAADSQAQTDKSEHKGIIYRNPRVYNVEYTFEMFPDPNRVDPDRDLKLWVPMPREWESQKAVKIISIEPEPHAKYVDPEYGNPMLFWNFGKDPVRPSYKVHVKYRLEQYDVHSNIDPNRIGNYDKTSKDYILYTRSTNTVTITDKVRELAKTAVGNEKNLYMQVKRIYKFVRDKMCYGPSGLGWKRSVEKILDRPVIDPKTGQEYYLGACYDQSMVFVALCRAAGIPARSVIAWWDERPWIRPTPENPEQAVEFREYSIDGLAFSAKRNIGGHEWAEVYLPNYGWVPVDPTFGRVGCSNVNNKVVIITKGRDIQIDPNAGQKKYGVYRAIGGHLCNGRAGLLLRGVFHASAIQRVKIELLHHPDPFPADAITEYTAKLYLEAEAEKNLGLYRKRVLRWLDQNTREHIGKISALAQAYKTEPRARYEHEAFICHMLRKVVGDKKFSDIHETYTNLRVKSGQPVSTARFQKIAEDVYGQPLDWFFKQWVGYTELPQLQLDAVTFSENEKGWHIRGNLRQLNKSPFRLPVELVVETEKATEHRTLWLEERNTDFEFSTTNRPKSILVDPNNNILQIRKMPPLLENPSYDEVAYCVITDQGKADWFDWTPLHFAARAGQTDIVEYLITNGADVNAENIEGKAPIQFAADNDHKEIVELLIVNGAEISTIHTAVRIGSVTKVKAFLEKGTDVNSKDASGRTALHIAAREGHKEIVELLLANAADVNIGERYYNKTAAEFAMNRGHTEIVELLVAKGADISSLHLALYMNDPAQTKSLIEGGADVNKRTPYGTTPLDRAVGAGFKDVVELLIQKGADVNAKDNWDWTPLHSAVYGHKEIVELLIAQGANVNARDGDNRTPLSYAKEEGHNEIVELLCKHGAKEDKEELGALLLQATADRDLEEVKSLISKGVDVNARDWRGTALHIAALGNHEAIAELLLAADANVDARHAAGNTPLHCAAVYGHRDIVELLIKNGANVKVRDSLGYTPLHWAASGGHSNVAELLIAKGADVNARQKENLTPLHEAARWGHLDVAQLLISKGADVEAQDKDGRTPLWYAKASGSEEVVDLLPNQGSDHDVAVTDLSVPSSCSQGDRVSVAVNVVNTSHYSETLVVMLTDVTDAMTIETKLIHLSPSGIEGMDEISDMTFPSPSTDPGSFGAYANCKGDINGDGYNDLIITAPQWNQNTGRAYLYYGGPELDASPDKIFEGESSGDFFGASVCIADLNGDHCDDVILGAHLYNNRQGRVYVFYGGENMDPRCDLILNAEKGTMGAFGRVISAGDVNSDGHDDLLISAPERCRVYLYFGGSPMNVSHAKVFEGDNANDAFGNWATIGEDVDADGYHDILIGARYFPGGNPAQGRAYLYYGSDKLSMDTACDVLFDCPESGRANFGCSVGMSDIDNDGHADVIIGARFAYNIRGRVYLYWGSERTSMDSIPDKIFTGEAGSNLGGDTLHCGHFNDDNYRDIAIAAYNWHHGNHTGRVYVYYGGTKTGMDENADKILTGVLWSRLGVWFNTGDLNNDNYDDIIAGGYRYNNNQGRAWLYYGGPGDSTQLKFDWDTSTASPGKHTLRATIAPVAGEEDTADNRMTVEVEVKAAERR